MAEDPRSRAATEDLPSARQAFEESSASAEEATAVAVARAAALLSLVRPPDFPRHEYLRVIAETRDLLGVEPVEPDELGREAMFNAFESLGGAGSRAIQRLYKERRRPREAEEAGFGPATSSSGESSRVMEDLRPATPVEREVVAAARIDAARQIFSGQPTGRRDVSRLIAASLIDDDPLVQVAAAAAALRIDARNPIAEDVLLETDRDGSSEVAELSRAILVADRRAETRRIEIEYPSAQEDKSADSALIHGTWARWGRWWRPGGELHRYLREEEQLFPHLYQGRQPFAWSGYFSFRAWAWHLSKDWHRQQAADSLAWWAHRKLTHLPDLIGHSYGGSISMMVTRAEKELRGLVLLSPAVHRTCLPDSNMYEKALHVTANRDLVLLADLSTPQLLETVPNMTPWRIKRTGLTGHACTHDPGAWQASGLTDHLRDIWLPSLTSRP